jgi:hypothetical protein
MSLAAAAAAGAAALYALQQILAVSRGPAKQHRDGEDGRAAAAGDGGSGGGAANPSPLRQPPPHPSWQPPQKLPPPFATNAMHTVDPAQTPSDVLYPLVISAVVPRPIGAWSTRAGSSRCMQPTATPAIFHQPTLVVPYVSLPLQRLCPPRAASAWATWLPTLIST